MSEVKMTVGNNHIFQIHSESTIELLPVDQIVESWRNVFSFNAQGSNSTGLRPAQLGAIFSIKAHWIVSNEPATIVMPTGTGKTETMIATVVSEMINRTLIIVPSDLLRRQTAKKFLTFGILQDIGTINSSALKPTVTALIKTPKKISDKVHIIV